MRVTNQVLAMAAAVAMAVSITAFSGSTSAGEPVGPKLTPRLQDLLSTEMQQVAGATANLALAIAAGDHHTVRHLGLQIRDSFILKQSLTDQDKKDLMGAVPKAFIALDKEFHAMAGKLAHAGEAGDSALQGFYYAEMIERCVACHSHFAADFFVGFAEEKAGGDDHHEH